MTVKKMVQIYKEYGADERTWRMFCEMYCHGIIDSEKWQTFYEKCKDWSFDERIREVVDGQGNIVK